MRRREFITLLGGGAAMWPLAAHAQRRVPVIGFLNSASAESWKPFVSAFRQGLDEAGFAEGRNVAIEYRWADDQYDRLPALAVDLVRRQPSVIVANQVSAAAAKEATATIPIVFTTGVDPVQLGLVASLARPGGNLTGVTTLNLELVPKRLELLHELAPTANPLALLVKPTSSGTETVASDARASARALGLELDVVEASNDRDLETAFASLAQRRIGGLVIAPDPFFVSRIKPLAALTLRYALPAAFEFRQFAAAGGLISYGGSLADSYRLAGIYAGRILKGANPADLPVQQSAKVELFLNLKTAKALGITVPLSLSGRADEIFE
jgi:putative tryptophan/tyrosine transport system substrate-binding protein